MSLKHNIFANSIGQLYVMLINIIMVPVYLRYMGVEAYGLVGFFSLMQMWFQLLDFGLSPTLGREVARFRGGVLSEMELRRLLRAMEILFYFAAIIGGALIVSMSGSIARHWLKVQYLSYEQVSGAITLMGLAVAPRLVSGIYRGAICGFERQVWLNGCNIFIATIRFIVIIPVFIYIGTSPKVFFLYQLVISGLELMFLAAKTHRLMPAVHDRIGWSLAPLRGVLKFSLSVAVVALIYVMVTQIDKVVLSKIIPLTEFGFFSVGVLVASSVALVGSPFSQALLPRLVKMDAEGDTRSFIALYRRATQWVCIVAAPLTAILVLFSAPILWAWTGSQETAEKAAPILRLYAIGNGIFAVAAFQSYIQFAKGNLRLQIIGNIIFVAVLVPLLVWAAHTYGGVGAGYVWVGQSAFYLLVWTWVVHRRFMPGLHWRWLSVDVLPIWLAVAGVAVIASSLSMEGVELNRSRWQVLLILGGLGAGFLVTGVLVRRETRAIVGSMVKSIFVKREGLELEQEKT